MTIIVSERLYLAQLQVSDAAFMLRLCNTPQWIKFIGDRGLRTEEDAANYLKNGALKSYAENGFGPYLVGLKTSNVPIGLCGLVKRDGLDHVDLGYAFLPEYTGRGYAYEAAAGTLNYAKDTLGLVKVLAIVQTDNLKSIKLLERLNMQLERCIVLPNENTPLLLYTT